MKKYIESFLNNVLIEGFLISLILFNLFVFIFEINKTFYSTYSISIQYFEWFSVTVFSLEYTLRVISLKNFNNILKPIMIIDLLAILPFYLSLRCVNKTIVGILSFCKMFRIAKLARYKNILINF